MKSYAKEKGKVLEQPIKTTRNKEKTYRAQKPQLKIMEKTM